MVKPMNTKIVHILDIEVAVDVTNCRLLIKMFLYILFKVEVCILMLHAIVKILQTFIFIICGRIYHKKTIITNVLPPPRYITLLNLLQFQC